MDFADNWNGSGNYKEKVSERTLQMNETQTFEQPYVFGLDIGTRNVVGTVGYKEGNEFIVVAQYVMQHETRAMIDGQIHDIGRVGIVFFPREVIINNGEIIKKFVSEESYIGINAYVNLSVRANSEFFKMCIRDRS